MTSTAGIPETVTATLLGEFVPGARVRVRMGGGVHIQLATILRRFDKGWYIRYDGEPTDSHGWACSENRMTLLMTEAQITATVTSQLLDRILVGARVLHAFGQPGYYGTVEKLNDDGHTAYIRWERTDSVTPHNVNYLQLAPIDQ